MSKNKNLLAVCIVLIVCLIVIVFSDSIHGSEKKYEIEPEITLPEYQNDLGRVINAYERMMDRMMYINEKNFAGINTDVKDISKKLVSIDRKLTELSKKMTRIEKALNIDQPGKPVEKTSEVKNDANDSLKIESEKP
jgi:predicted  nucleic acid-binding Zn-ribbon protein